MILPLWLVHVHINLCLVAWSNELFLQTGSLRTVCGSHNDEWLTESHSSCTVSQEYDTSTVVSARPHEFQIGCMV